MVPASSSEDDEDDDPYTSTGYAPLQIQEYITVRCARNVRQATKIWISTWDVIDDVNEDKDDIDEEPFGPSHVPNPSQAVPYWISRELCQKF